MIEDLYPESSPLVGLLSIFETISENEFFVLSVDAPFVDEAVIEKIYEASRSDKYDAIIAQSPGGAQPLCGIYRRSILPYARDFMSRGKHKLNALLKDANTCYVPFGNESAFENLNHPHQYEAALKTVQREGGGSSGH